MRNRASYPLIPPVKRPISADDAHEVHQAHDGGSNEGAEAKCDLAVIVQDAPALDAPDAMLHVDAYGCQSALLCALLFGQVSVSLNNSLQT
jgi:hypothetical protein